jgi:hypothetical protein
MMPTATKAKAEQIVKAVRGVKSVDNQIVVLGWKPDDRLSQQPIKLIFDHAVTLTYGCFQLLAVEDLNVTADVGR